jgi:signal transduction histidine kinase/DNA-binding response OmpR family regulator
MSEEKVDILIVDDLPEKLLVYETILQSLAQNLVTARSGREALRHLLERDFAVILLDVHMPEMDGFETAALVRQRRQSADTPIIFMTAFADEMNTAHGYSLGAVDYILTPIIPEILRTKVGVFVDLYKKTRQVKRQAEERAALARVRAARDAAEEANRRSAFLAEASNVLARSLDYAAIPRGLARQAIPFLGDLCAVTLTGLGGEGDWSTDLTWIDPADVSCLSTMVEGELPYESLSELIRRVLESGETGYVLVAEAAGGEARSGSRSQAVAQSGATRAGLELRSAIVAPLRARGHTLGTLAVALGQGSRRYGPDDVALVENLADRAAVAIDNARLYRDIQEKDRRNNEFLAMLGHELRNPLAPIRNAVDFLQMLDMKDQNLQWASDVIARQLGHLVRLVDDLLDVSRITAGRIQLRREPVDAAAAVERAVETSRPLIEARKHELTVTLPATPILLHADLVRLAQVLGNLLNNAAKYTEQGGKIALEVAQTGLEASFHVRDNGIGIAADKLAGVFDLFTQVDPSLDRAQGGLGIGLTLVRRIVEMHGGTVEAHSPGKNRGSEFIIRLPVLVEPVASAAPSPCNPQHVESVEPRRILLVDDYPFVAEALMKILKLGGHDVRIARDGSGALAEVARDRPDIALLDIGLPGIDGYELAARIRSQPGNESMILIALTGYGQEEDLQRAWEAGFDYHLTKPVECTVLLDLIASGGTRSSAAVARAPDLART